MDASQDLLASSLRHGRSITPDDGDGDDEHPLAMGTKVQNIITASIDKCVHEGLLQMHEGEGTWPARTRLSELSDTDVDHTWLWRLSPRHGPVLNTKDDKGTDKEFKSNERANPTAGIVAKCQKTNVAKSSEIKKVRSCPDSMR